MENLDDIFVPYEIALKLKEIGFDADCIGAYDCYCMLHIINSNDRFSLDKNEIFAYAPTWEQVKKWFREKGLDCHINNKYIDNQKTNYYVIDRYKSENGSVLGYIRDDFNTYEEAQEEMILELIEIYKNGK